MACCWRCVSLLERIAEDPILRDAKLIVETWDAVSRGCPK